MSKHKSRSKAYIPPRQPPYIRIVYTGRHPPGTRTPYTSLRSAMYHERVPEPMMAMEDPIRQDHHLHRVKRAPKVMPTPPKQKRKQGPKHRRHRR